MSWFSFRFEDFAISFLSIILEGIPFLLAGTLISGLIDAFLPAKVFERFNPRRPVVGIFLAAALPLVLPMCECGVVPVVRRLIRKGFPAACAVAYMISAPIVNPIVALSTFAAFSGGFATSDFFSDGSAPWVITGLRLFLGFFVALLTASLAMQFEPRLWLAEGKPPRRRPVPPIRAGVTVQENGWASVQKKRTGNFFSTGNFWPKCVEAVRCAASDFLDVSFFLVVGAALTAIFNTALNQAVLEPVATEPVAATGAMMGLAFILALCSTSDAFVANTFTMFPLSAKLAFLVFGPVADVKLVFLYGMIFKRRVVIVFVLAAFFLIGALCLRVADLIR